MRKLLVLVSAVILAASAQICAEDSLKPTQNVNGLHEYTAKNFDFLIGKVNGIQDDLLKMHMKLYQGYVTNTNLILSKIRELDAKNENKSPLYAGLKRMLGWEFDGMLLHECYFESLGGGGMMLDTSSPLFAKIQADYGSFDVWKADFIATGLMRGIGWVIAYVDPKDGRVTNVWINEHDVGHLAGGTPLLVMDVFEHAYITQFGLDRGKYIDVFFNNINWKKVSERYNSLKK